MAARALQSVRILANHGAVVVHTSGASVFRRFERPNGRLSVPETALVLKTYPEMVRRMGRAGRLRMARRGRRRVLLADLRRLLRLPADRRATAERNGKD